MCNVLWGLTRIAATSKNRVKNDPRTTQRANLKRPVELSKAFATPDPAPGWFEPLPAMRYAPAHAELDAKDYHATRNDATGIATNSSSKALIFADPSLAGLALCDLFFQQFRVHLAQRALRRRLG